MSITINRHQLQQLLDAIGDEDTEVELAWLPAGTFIDGDPREAGLYMWWTECPEEGVMLLPKSPPEQRSTDDG